MSIELLTQAIELSTWCAIVLRSTNEQFTCNLSLKSQNLMTCFPCLIHLKIIITWYSDIVNLIPWHCLLNAIQKVALLSFASINDEERYMFCWKRGWGKPAFNWKLNIKTASSQMERKSVLFSCESLIWLCDQAYRQNWCNFTKVSESIKKFVSFLRNFMLS